jgi:hypothetical protein
MSMKVINKRMDALRRYLRNVRKTSDPAWIKNRRQEWYAVQQAAGRAAREAA